MKNSISILLLTFCVFSLLAQSKNERINQLINSNDSLKKIILQDHHKYIVKTIEFESTIDKLNESNNLLQSEIKYLKSNLSIKNKEIIAIKDSTNKANEYLKNIINEKEIEILKEKPDLDFLITNNSVGLFRIGNSWQYYAKNYYRFNFKQTFGKCIDGACDGGFILGDNLKNTENKNLEVEEGALLTIGASPFMSNNTKSNFNNNQNIFFISSANNDGWYWKDKTSYIIVHSDKFKTKEGIGVGSTLSELKRLLVSTKIKIGWLREDINAIKVEAKAYPGIKFIIEYKDAIGGLDNLESLDDNGLEINESNFNENARIARIIVEESK